MAKVELVGEPHGIWKGKYFSNSLFDCVSFDINNQLYSTQPSRMPAKWQANQEIEKAKRRLLKAGYATQADANFLSLKILEKYPCLAKSLAIRFPLFIIDEAQDTSNIQMKVIEILAANGIEGMMLVGDPDQAIFEWNEAKPQLLNQKFSEWDESVILNENRRSSKLICNFTFGLSSLEVASNPVNHDVCDFGVAPKVVKYTSQTIATEIEAFLNLCRENGVEVNPKNVAVLYRSKSFLYEITGVQKPDNINAWADKHPTHDIAFGKFLVDRKDFKKGRKYLERGIIKLENDLDFCTDEDIEAEMNKLEFGRYREKIHNLVAILPSTLDGSSLGQWLDQANKKMKDIGLPGSLKCERKAKTLQFNQIFYDEANDLIPKSYRLGTIHSAKGETFEAVMVMLKTKGLGKAYKTLIKEGTGASENEEMRIVYVGITRPRKILVLAVPDEENKNIWESKLLSAGTVPPKLLPFI